MQYNDYDYFPWKLTGTLTIDAFKSFLDMFTHEQWTIIGLSCAIVLRLLTWLSTWYFRKKRDELGKKDDKG
ncbi:hypothetical protein N7Y48_004725 [Salmonella enterica]|nr:hypothetical protein [Salmonella enterica]EJV8546849.1 hypothetical protein [Salmonella enterica]